VFTRSVVYGITPAWPPGCAVAATGTGSPAPPDGETNTAHVQVDAAEYVMAIVRYAGTTTVPDVSQWRCRRP